MNVVNHLPHAAFPDDEIAIYSDGQHLVIAIDLHGTCLCRITVSEPPPSVTILSNEPSTQPAEQL